jgi:hypothetical protein
MAEVSASRHNALVQRIITVLGNGSGSFGYGQGLGYGATPSSFEVSNNPANNTNIITAESINAIYADMVRTRIHQRGTEPQEIAELIANANIIAETESFIVGDGGISVIDPNGTKKGIVDFENLMQSIENERFLMAPTEATLEPGITSTRTTVWNDFLIHEFTVTFNTSDHRRHYFNSGGQIRISAAIDKAITGKGQSWSQFLRSFGVIIFDYERTVSSVTGNGTARGNSQLTDVYQTIYSSTGSGFYNTVYNGNEYKIEARAPNYINSNDLGNSIQFKITFNDKAIDGTIDGNVDGTARSVVEIYRADTNNVRVNPPAITTDIGLSDLQGLKSSYTLSSNKPSIKEGESFTITLNTLNVPNGPVPYTISGVQIEDFNLTSLTGSFTVNNNIASNTFISSTDGITEGTETFTLTLNTGETVSVTVDDQVLPATNDITCIAVIDESSVSATTLRNNWLSFRTSYPNRPFYLLQPSGASYTRNDLRIPAEFENDNLAFYSSVNRDNGNSSQASDWYSICNIDQLPDGSEFALWIDNSGSMSTSQVRASLILLDSKIQPRNITYRLLAAPGENWVSPFIRSF